MDFVFLYILNSNCTLQLLQFQGLSASRLARRMNVWSLTCIEHKVAHSWYGQNAQMYASDMRQFIISISMSVHLATFNVMFKNILAYTCRAYMLISYIFE